MGYPQHVPRRRIKNFGMPEWKSGISESIKGLRQFSKSQQLKHLPVFPSVHQARVINPLSDLSS